MRWIASLVAEVHRILMRGGSSCTRATPRTRRKPGRLRLLYEANPMAMIIEQAGGARHRHGRILEVQPTAAPAHAGRPRLEGRGRAHRALPREHEQGLDEAVHVAAVQRALACSATDARRASAPCLVAEEPHVRKHPIIAVTGSSGAGTTSVTRTFEHIFRASASTRRSSRATVPPLRPRRDEGAMAEAAQQGNKHFSHFGPRTNLFPSSRRCSGPTARRARGKRRKYLHDEEEAAPYKQPSPARSRPGRTSPGRPTCCSTKACTARW
jgi:hypothetical protein